MQDIDQHMDDLSRRAAADYPLRVNESHWEAIAGQLSAAATTAASNRPVANYLRGIFVLLFLFTSGIFICRQPAGIKLAAIKDSGVAPTVIIEQTITAAPVTTTPARLATTYFRGNPGLPARAGNAQESNAATAQPLLVEDGNARTPHQPVMEQTSGIELSRHAKIETIPTPPANVITSTQAQVSTKRGRWYAGIAGGPEGNQVKGQVVSTCGFDAGLVLGFDFNDRFSIESGLLFTKKHYFCDGQNFNMEMPGMKLESLEGKSRLVEIPLKLKYNIVRKRSWNVFSTAGLSSYVLNNERNNYLLLVNGTRQNMVSNYENASRYFAAAVDVSIGYELKASPRLRLRLQPYLQLPLKGIGVGSIPVKSMGLHAGIIRSFGHK
jgi:hypothetical protein